jgi:hypothetical protein
VTRIEQAQSEFLELEVQIEQKLSLARHLLIEAADEARRIRAEAERFSLEIFTEEEAVQKLRMSQDTLQRLRKKKNLPHLRAGMLVRYSSQHLVEIVEILERGGNIKRGK